MSIIKINITKPLIFEFLRENNVTLDFPTTTDYSTKKLKFAIKLEKDQTSPEVVIKKNALNGGSDAQILVTPTNIAVNILYNDTPSLATGKWYCSVNDVDDEIEIVNAIIILQSPVQSVYDPGYIPPAIPGSQKIFSVISNVLTPEIDNGYNATLTLTKLGTGIYQIDSNVDLFTSEDILMISEILEADTDIYLFKKDAVTTKQLIVTIIPFFGGGTSDKDFRVAVYRSVPANISTPLPTATKVVSIVSNILTPETDSGYNSNLSLTVTAPGVYQLNSDIPMFTNQEIVTITPILEADTDVYFYKYNLTSTTQLQISVFAFFAGGNVNKDIRISINRITP